MRRQDQAAGGRAAFRRLCPPVVPSNPRARPYGIARAVQEGRPGLGPRVAVVRAACHLRPEVAPPEVARQRV